MPVSSSIDQIAIETVERPSKAEYFKDLLLVLTQKEVKVRYRNTWLGYAWSLLNPLTFAFVYYVAFGVFMKVPIENYVVFLIMGMFPWQWMSHSLSTAPNIFLANASLIKKVKFPWNMLVFSAVGSFAVQFVFSLPVMAALAMYHGHHASVAWLVGIPILAGIQFVTLYGAALAIACANLFFRDLDRLVSLGVTFLFFMTPITYTANMVPMEYRLLMNVNPMTPIIVGWQELFLTGELPWHQLSKALVVGLCTMFVGKLIYRRLSRRFAEVI